MASMDATSNQSQLSVSSTKRFWLREMSTQTLISNIHVLIFSSLNVFNTNLRRFCCAYGTYHNALPYYFANVGPPFYTTLQVQPQPQAYGWPETQRSWPCALFQVEITDTLRKNDDHGRTWMFDWQRTCAERVTLFQVQGMSQWS